MTCEEQARRHRMTVNGVPQMYQSALLDNEYMESLLKQTDQVHKKRQCRMQRSANLAKITFWALAFQACIGILLFLWLVVLTPTFCIVGTGILPNLDTRLVLQTSQGMLSQWNRQQEAMKVFGVKTHQKVAEQKLKFSENLTKELAQTNNNALGWRRHLPGSGAHAAIDLQGGFMSVSAGSFSREVENVSKPIILCTRDRVDEKTLPDSTVQEEFKEGSQSCYDPSQAFMLQNQRVLDKTTDKLELKADEDGVQRLKETVRDNTYPSNTLYVTQQTWVNKEDTLNIGDVVHGYTSKKELNAGAKLDLKVTRPAKYQGAAQIFSALNYCADTAAEGVVQQCIIVADASGTCRFREWKYMKDYCEKFGGEDAQCSELLKSKMPADIGEDDWKECTELVSMNKLNVTLMIFADTEKQDKRLMKANGFRGFVETVTGCKFKATANPITNELSYEIPPIYEDESNLECARIILSRDWIQMDTKVEQLAKSINLIAPAITAPSNPEHDPKYTWFLLLILPLVFYIFYIQIANCVIKLQRRARVLAGQKKRRIKIVKTLVVRPPDAARNKSLIAIRGQLGDVELAALATMRTPLMHGNTINLRAKLRGAYVRAPELGMPIIADGKAVEWGSDWQVERVQGFGPIMQGDECYLKDQEGMYLALAESEDGRQACITVQDKDSAQVMIFGRALTAAEESNEQQDRYPIRVGDTVSIREPSGGLLRAIRAERNIQGGVVGGDEGFMDFKGQEDGLDIFFEVDVGGDLLMSDTLLVLQHELTGKNIESRAAQPIHMTDEGSPARFFTIEKHLSTGADEGSSDFLSRGDLVKIRNVHGEYLRVSADDPTQIESAPFPLPAPASSGSSEEPSADDNDIQRFLFALDKLGVDVDRKDSTIRLDAALALRAAYGERSYIKVTSEGEISCDGSRLDKNIGFRVSIDNAVSELKDRNKETRKRVKTVKKVRKEATIAEEEDEAAAEHQRETAKLKQRDIEKALAALDDQEVMQKELEQKREEEEQRKKLEQEKQAGKYKWKVTSNTNYIRGGGAVMRVDFGKGPLPPSAQNKIKVDTETGKQVADTSQGTSFQVSRADSNANMKVTSVCYIDEESFINKELNDSQFDLDDSIEESALDEARARAIQEQLPDDSDYMIDYQFESVEVGYDVSNEELAEEDMLNENASAWTPVPRVKKQHFAVAVGIIAVSTILLMIFVGVKISARWTPPVGDGVQDLNPVRRLNAMDQLEPPLGMPNFYIQDKPCDNSTKSEAYHASQKNMTSFDFLGVKRAAFPKVSAGNTSHGKVFRELAETLEDLGTIRVQVDIMGKMFNMQAYVSESPHEVPQKFKNQAENVQMWIMAIISEYMLQGSTPVKVDKKLRILPPAVAWPSDETQYFDHHRPFFEHVNEFTFTYRVKLPEGVPVKRTTYGGSWVKDELAHTLCLISKQDEEFKDAILRAIEESQAMYPHDTAWTANLNLDVVGIRIVAEDAKFPGDNYQCDAMTEAFMYPKTPRGALERKEWKNGGRAFSYQVAPGYELQGGGTNLQPKPPRDQEMSKDGNQWEHQPVKVYSFCKEIQVENGREISAGKINERRSARCQQGYLNQPLNTKQLEVVEIEVYDEDEEALLVIRTETNDKLQVNLMQGTRLPLKVISLTPVESLGEQFENGEDRGVPVFKIAWVSKLYAGEKQFGIKEFWEMSADERYGNGELISKWIVSLMNETIQPALNSNKKVFIDLLQYETWCGVGMSAQGTWSGSLQCTPISCGEPPEKVENAYRVDSQIKSFNEKAAYKCEEGYGVKGTDGVVGADRDFHKVCQFDMKFDSDTTCGLEPRYCATTSENFMSPDVAMKLGEVLDDTKCRSGYTSPVGVNFEVHCDKGDENGDFRVRAVLRLKDGTNWPMEDTGVLKLVWSNSDQKNAEETLKFDVVQSTGVDYRHPYILGPDKYIGDINFHKHEDGQIEAYIVSKELICAPIKDFCPAEQITEQMAEIGTIPAGPVGPIDRTKLEPKYGYQVVEDLQLNCGPKEEETSEWEGEWKKPEIVFEKKMGYCTQTDPDVKGLVSAPPGKVGDITQDNEGSVANVKCAEGWKRSDGQLECTTHDESSGLWRIYQNQDPCKKVECDSWPKMDHATIENEAKAESNPKFGDQATYTCKPGYTVEGLTTYTITCNKDGQHTELDGSQSLEIKQDCIKNPEYCPKLPSVNGIKSIMPKAIGEQEELTCRDGYERTGNSPAKHIRCEEGDSESQDTGKWSENPSEMHEYCVLKEDYCSPQSKVQGDHFPEEDQVIIEGGKLGENKEASCHMGYHVKDDGSTWLECKEDKQELGAWDPKPKCQRTTDYCPALEHCQDLQTCGPSYLGKTVDSQDVPCPDGQEYTGTEVNCSSWTEEAGVFHDDQGKQPTCKMIEGFCAEKEIEQGKISAAYYGAKAEITCNQGYFTKEWAGQCGKEREFVFPHTVVFNQEHIERGEETVTNSLPGCKPIRDYCKAVEEEKQEAFATFHLPDSHLKEVADNKKVECYKGREIKGKLQCTESRKWQLCEASQKTQEQEAESQDECKDIVCTKVQCMVDEAGDERRHAKENGELNKRETKIWEYEDERSFECVDGYVYPDPDEQGTEKSGFKVKCLETRVFEDHSCKEKPDYCTGNLKVECIGDSAVTQCYDAPAIESRSFKTKVTIRCKPGYYVNGGEKNSFEGESMCNTDMDGDRTTGSWTPLSCRVDTEFCPKVPADEELGLSEEIPNGSVDSKHTVTCKNGYLAKVGELKCKAKERTGNWVHGNDLAVIGTKLCGLKPAYCPARSIELTSAAQDIVQQEELRTKDLQLNQKLQEELRTKDLQLNQQLQVSAPKGLKIQDQAETSVQVVCTEGNHESGVLDKVIKFDADLDYCPQVKEEETKIKAELEISPQTHKLGDKVSMSCQLGYVERQSKKANFEIRCDKGEEDSNTGRWMVIQDETEFQGCLKKESYCPEIQLENLEEEEEANAAAKKQLIAGKIDDSRDWKTKTYCKNGFEGSEVAAFFCRAASEDQGQWLPQPVCTEKEDYCKWSEEEQDKQLFPGVQFLQNSALNDEVEPVCKMGFQKNNNFKCEKKDGFEKGEYKPVTQGTQPCGKIEKYCQEQQQDAKGHIPGVTAAALGAKVEVQCISWKEPINREVECKEDGENTGQYVPPPACKKKADYCQGNIIGAQTVVLTGQREEEKAAKVLSEICGAGYEYKKSLLCNDDCDDIKHKHDRCESPEGKGAWYEEDHDHIAKPKLTKVTDIECTKVDKFCHGSFSETTTQKKDQIAKIDETITMQCKTGFHAAKKGDEDLEIRAKCTHDESGKGKFEVEADTGECVKVKKWCETIESLSVPDGTVHETSTWQCPIGQIPRIEQGQGNYGLDGFECHTSRKWRYNFWAVQDVAKVCKEDAYFCSVEVPEFEDAHITVITAGDQRYKKKYFKHNEQFSVESCAAGYERNGENVNFQCVHDASKNTYPSKGKLDKDLGSACKKVVCKEIGGTGIVLKKGTELGQGIEFEDTVDAFCVPGYYLGGGTYGMESFQLTCNKDKKLVTLPNHKCQKIRRLCQCNNDKVRSENGKIVCAGNALNIHDKGEFVCENGYKSVLDEVPDISCEVGLEPGQSYSQQEQKKAAVLKKHTTEGNQEAIDKEFIERSCQQIDNYCAFNIVPDNGDQTKPIKVEGLTVNSELKVTCQPGWAPQASYKCAPYDANRGQIVYRGGGQAHPACEEQDYWCAKPHMTNGKWKGASFKYNEVKDVESDCYMGYEFPAKLTCGDDKNYKVTRKEERHDLDNEFDNIAKGEFKCIPIKKYCVAEIRIGEDGTIPEDWGDTEADKADGVAIGETVRIAKCPVGYQEAFDIAEARCAREKKAWVKVQKNNEGYVYKGLSMCKKKEDFCTVRRQVGIYKVTGKNKIYETWHDVCSGITGYEAAGTTCCTSKGEFKVLPSPEQGTKVDEAWCKGMDQELITKGKGPEASCKKVECHFTARDAHKGNWDYAAETQDEYTKKYQETAVFACKKGYGFRKENGYLLVAAQFKCTESGEFKWGINGPLTRTIPVENAIYGGTIPPCQLIDSYCESPQVKCDPVTHEGCVEEFLTKGAKYHLGDETAEIKCAPGYELWNVTDQTENLFWDDDTAPKLKCLEDTHSIGKWDASYKCKAKTCELPQDKWGATKGQLVRSNIENIELSSWINHHDLFKLECPAGKGPESVIGKEDRKSKPTGYCDGATGKIWELPYSVTKSVKKIRDLPKDYQQKQQEMTGCVELTDYCRAESSQGVKPGALNSKQEVQCGTGKVNKENTEKTTYEITCKEGDRRGRGKWDPEPTWKRCTKKENFCEATKETKENHVMLPGGKYEERINPLKQEHCSDSTVLSPDAVNAECDKDQQEGGIKGEWKFWGTQTDLYNNQVCIIEKCKDIQETISEKGLFAAGDHHGFEQEGCDKCQTDNKKKGEDEACSCKVKCKNGYFNAEEPDEPSTFKNLECSKGEFQDIPKCYSTIEIEVKNFDGQVVEKAKINVTDNMKENDEGEEFELVRGQTFFWFNKVCEHCTFQITGEATHVPMTVEWRREKDCGNRHERDSNMKLKCERRTLFLVDKVKGEYDKETCTVSKGNDDSYEIRVGLSWPKNSEKETKDHDLIIRPVECDKKAKAVIKADASANYKDVWEYRCKNWLVNTGHWCTTEKLGAKQYVAAIYETFQEKKNNKYVPLKDWKDDYPMKEAGKLKKSFNDLQTTCLVEAQSANWMDRKEDDQASRLVQCLGNRNDDEEKYWISLNQYDKWVMGTFAARMTKLIGKDEQVVKDSKIVINHDQMTAPGSETITLTNVPAGMYEIMVTNGNPSTKESLPLTADAQVNIFLPGITKEDQTSLAVKCRQTNREHCRTDFMWKVAVLEIQDGAEGSKRVRIYSGKQMWSNDLNKHLFGVMDDFVDKIGNEGSWRGQKKLLGSLYQQNEDHDVGTPTVLKNWQNFDAKGAIDNSCTSVCEMVREDLKNGACDLVDNQ